MNKFVAVVVDMNTKIFYSAYNSPKSNKNNGSPI